MTAMRNKDSKIAPRMKNVLVTGGAGYVGCRLVPELFRRGYNVRILDLLLFGDQVFDEIKVFSRPDVVVGDIRDASVVKSALDGIDAVIHLAAIANDPSADLDPKLTKQVNYDAVLQMIDLARAARVKRFINASTATVYGVKQELGVTEEAQHDPISLYGKYKSESEAYVLKANSGDFTTVSLRAATVCGYSPRQRLDLTVNILTHHAILKKRITVFGGEQMRPNITIADLVRAYLTLLEAHDQNIAGEAFNVGNENYKVIDIARLVQEIVGPAVEIKIVPVLDERSYHVSSEKIRRQLGFSPNYRVEDAVREVAKALEDHRIPDPENSRYYNLRHMQEVGFQ